MKRFLFLFLCGVILATAADARKKAKQEEFPILAWYSIPPGEFATLERYQELRDAGFTHSFGALINKTEDAMTALDLCAKVGLKSVFRSADLKAKPEETVRKVMKHPGLGAYFLRDEPRNDALDELGNWARRIQSVDQKHPCYLNLFPLQVFGHEGYIDHIRQFNEKVNLPQISYDHYPIHITDKGLTVNSVFWENLEVVSSEARRAGKPFWAFTLSTPHFYYPMPDISHLRLQLYADLAYGAQLLQYFTYWNPQPHEGDYHEAPINQFGKRSPMYEIVRDMNREIQARARVFLGCSVQSVFHTGDEIPEGTTRLKELPPRFLEFDTQGKGALVSNISNKGKRYVIVQNTSVKEDLPIRITTDNMVKMILRDGAEEYAYKYGPLFIIPKGDVLVFEIL